jgi:diguanylate cyclase (GGDEF)-like protein/PAS domain S-box-containing protein
MQCANKRSELQPFWSQSRVWLIEQRVAWIVLLLSLLVTLWVSNNARENLLLAQQVEFKNRAAQISDAVLFRMRTYEQVLRGGVGLFTASENVTRAEFQDYIASIDIQNQYPGIQGIGYSLQIPAARLNAHNSEIRAQGFTDYAIFPAGVRDLYTATIYFEPFGWRNQRAFGFDMFSETNRRTAMENARDTGRAVLSAKVTLIQETDRAMQPGLLLYLPQYKNGAPHTNLAERRSNLRGYIHGSFRLNDLMNGILKKNLGDAEADINLEIFNSSAPSADSLLYADDGVARMLSSPLTGRLTLTQSIDMYGQTWFLYFASRPAFHAAFDQSKQLYLLGLGTLLSVMLAALMWMFTNQQRRALVLANSMRNEINERKKTEEGLRLAALMSKHSSEAMMVTDSNALIINVNHAFTEVTGYTLEEIIGKNFKQFNARGHDHAFYQAMWHAVNTFGHWQGEILNRRKNGALFLTTTAINSDYHDDGSVHRYIFLFSDITQKRESEKLIWEQANFDSLTGLPNRHMFHDRLAQTIKKSERSGLPAALLLIDLDRFKEVNDALGHAQGDILLTEAARRISSCVRESDIVARLGGDEFIVILAEIKDKTNAECIAQNIIDSLSTPFELLQDKVYVFASMGITLYPDDHQNIEALIKNADQAMYVAKNLGGNRFSYFTKDLQLAADSRVNMIKDLRAALAANQLAVHYQPIVEIATGKIYKAEALLRWQHPVLGMISPAQFIPLAEESRLIHEIGDWVFQEVTRELVRWRKDYAPAFQISINVSPVQLRQNRESIGSPWIEHLHAVGLPGDSLNIEITEGILLSAETTVTDKIHMFRDAGIKVSIDDFGTGYSSLSYLKKFDIDYLKIDQTFIRNLEKESDDMALCEAIVVMAHKLGLKVIAEGVETAQQRDLLASFGCDYAQGWLYAKAVPAEEFEALLVTTA